MEYNITSEGKCHKYAINIPLDLWGRLEEITAPGTKYNGSKSTFIRDVLYNAIIPVNEGTISAKELSRRESEAQEIILVDPPRKYLGFIGGLLRNSFVNQCSKRSAEEHRIARSVDKRNFF